MVFEFLAFPWVGGVGFLGRKYKEIIGTRARKNTENFVFFSNTDGHGFYGRIFELRIDN